MKKLFNVILVLMAMVALLIEKSSCYQILVVGLLFLIMLSLEKRKQ